MDTPRTNARIASEATDCRQRSEIHFATWLVWATWLIREPTKAFLQPAFQGCMDGHPACLQVVGDRLGVPSLGVEPDNGNATGYGIGYLMEVWVPTLHDDR